MDQEGLMRIEVGVAGSHGNPSLSLQTGWGALVYCVFCSLVAGIWTGDGGGRGPFIEHL